MYKVRPKIDGVVFPSLSEEENEALISTFTLEEIEEVVRYIDGNKSLGPDDFNFAFLKKFWEMLKGDLGIMFDQFHDKSCLSKSFLSYFVTLIPKITSPSLISDFRPDDKNFYGIFSISISSKMTKTNPNTKENLQKKRKASRQGPRCQKTRKSPKNEENEHSIVAR
ncbi:hypothetical protein QL285_044632 [Trifolium repens]|nr:hypothetical protein QL285_044632 [Trifolium repens]